MKEIPTAVLQIDQIPQEGSNIQALIQFAHTFNSHKNARTTFEGRKLLIERIAMLGLMPAAEAAGISARTACKWRDRFEQEGIATG